MITKNQFVRYCVEERRTHGEITDYQNDAYFRGWIERNNQKTLYELFNLVGLWGRYVGEFKYSALAKLKFEDLPETELPNYTIDQILEKL